MKAEEVARLLRELKSGKRDEQEVLELLKSGPLHMESDALHFPDHHRVLRMGLGEVILAGTKSTDHVLHVAEKYRHRSDPVLFTRLRKKQIKKLKPLFPEARFNDTARTMIMHPPPQVPADSDRPFVLILSAGTSDMPVVEEAAETCRAMRVPCMVKADVGVAGLHRVLHQMEVLQKAAAIVVVAGMEGALPSVVGGLADSPVFAVPTSVGYGASFKGLSALLGMLNSCAPGITVVNIDNGFSAAFAAGQVIRQIEHFVSVSK